VSELSRRSSAATSRARPPLSDASNGERASYRPRQPAENSELAQLCGDGTVILIGVLADQYLLQRSRRTATAKGPQHRSCGRMQSDAWRPRWMSRRAVKAVGPQSSHPAAIHDVML
jgi:hypothetical protein